MVYAGSLKFLMEPLAAAAAPLATVALTALFIVLAVDAYKQRPDRVTVPAATVSAGAAWLMLPE